MKIISGSSEHLAMQLEDQVYLGSYSWNVVDDLMLKAANMLRKQQKAVDALMKAADKSAGLRIKAEQELQEYKKKHHDMHTS